MIMIITDMIMMVDMIMTMRAPCRHVGCSLFTGNRCGARLTLRHLSLLGIIIIFSLDHHHHFKLADVAGEQLLIVVVVPL